MNALSTQFATLGAASLLAAQDPQLVAPEPTGFLAKTITLGSVEHRYVVYVPAGRPREGGWPLIVFLNGMGECGTDGERQTTVGLGPAIRADPQRWPFVVVFPQKPDRGSQWSDHEELVMGTLAATEKDHRIHVTRRFLTGLSQGGAGTWALASRHPRVWSAIAPVCGYGKPDAVGLPLQSMPIWAFHGLDDKTVPAQQSRDLCAAVERAGGSAVLTLYPNTAHNSWDKAYRESQLAEWLRTAGDRQLSMAIAEPEKLLELHGFRLRIRLVSQDGPPTEHEHESITLSIPARGDWRVHHSRSREVARPAGHEPVGEPNERKVPMREAAACLAECVTRLARAGVVDAPQAGTPIEGSYVEVDWSYGVGGRSVSDLPKRWKTGDAEIAEVEAIRRAAELLKRLR